MKQALLSAEEIGKQLRELSGWEYKDGALRREFKFKTFVQAFGFMASCALEAEKLNHHPDWSNVYGTVRVALSTHDSGGVTELDVTLARKMGRLASAPV